MRTKDTFCYRNASPARGNKMRGLSFTFLLGISLLPVTARGFDFFGNKWPGAETGFFAGISGVSPSGIPFNTAFIDAMDEWNEQTQFNFDLQEAFLDPCLNDGLNSVDFTTDVCDSGFGPNTLAVTIRRFALDVLGPARIAEADIVINQAVNFDVFDGPLSFIFGQETLLDFRRIVLHELGHVIGLDHEDGVPAIMASSIGNIDRLQADDIDGVNALYSALDNCRINTLKFGITQDALDDGDCTVAEMTAGGQDTSFIDLYRFDLNAITTVSFAMAGDNLDSILVLSDTELRFLGVDAKTTEACDSVLTRTLPPGSYFIMANTFDIPPREQCGNLGGYTLTASFNAPSQVALGANASLQGGMSSAQFKGGITANNGLSYGNRFAPGDSLDIAATITIDPLHQGRQGFLVVAAAVEDQALFLTESGQFVQSPLDPLQIPRAANKVLQAIEQIQIATDLVPADLGIQSISVDFFVGYGLAADPAELFFHGTPLNLTVAP